MQDIIDWLVEFEQSAAKFYTEAAEYFSDDAELSRLAREMAEDEQWHAEIMAATAKQYREMDESAKPPVSLVKVDVDSKRRIAKLFSDCAAKFPLGEVTKREFLESIIEAEYSEWNTYLLYVTKSVKGLTDRFETLPAKMNAHKGRIENYLHQLGDSPEAAGLIERIVRLPDLWTDRFLLVVDDDNMILELLKAILESKGVVDCAHNGKEALEKFGDKYYDVTISDIDMPKMGGIEFFHKVKETYPDVNERFIFFTGRITSEREGFFRENNLKYLSKPASIESIVVAIDELLKRSPKYSL
ncbi:MAG: response regulator [Proteobacteria bacterium]|nr:response regulator [Pseudomonadota bacterium]